MKLAPKLRGVVTAGATGRRAPQQSRAKTLAELLSRTADGECESFAALYDETCAHVYGVALQVLCDTGFAEETTHEVYLHVWRSACSFEATDMSVLAWLTTLAHRRAVDRVRSEHAHTARAGRYCIRTENGACDSAAEAPFDRIEYRTMKGGVASLPAGQRESITLAYQCGLTYREVAAHLGVPVPAIKSRIRAGLIRLSECGVTECVGHLDRPSAPHCLDRGGAEKWSV